MNRMPGQLAVVTGASSGVGAAIAAALLAEGAGVVGLARRFSREPDATPPASGQLVLRGLDVTDELAVEAQFAELPSLDVLVCAAGFGGFSSVLRTNVSDLRAMLEVHVVGTFLCVRAALRNMAAQRRGHIVTIGSVAATRPIADCGAYAAAKAGQHALTRVLTEEARSLGIRVTSVILGATDTAIWNDRPGFDRSQMLQASDVAASVVDVLARPKVSVEEFSILPPAGVL